MSRLDWHVAVVFGLVGITALTPALAKTRSPAASASVLSRLPTTLGPWTAGTAGTEPVLPTDVRSVESQSLAYERGDRRVWVAVARYPGVNDPTTRPGLGAVVPDRGLSSLVRETATFQSKGSSPMSTIRLTARFFDRQITAFYWYQLGRRVISNEYELRFWLAANTLLRREDPLFLVRVATLGDDDPGELFPYLVPYVSAVVAAAERT